jgi:hypothetical protein
MFTPLLVVIFFLNTPLGLWTLDLMGTPSTHVMVFERQLRKRKNNTIEISLNLK